MSGERGFYGGVWEWFVTHGKFYGYLLGRRTISGSSRGCLTFGLIGNNILGALAAPAINDQCAITSATLLMLVGEEKGSRECLW